MSESTTSQNQGASSPPSKPAPAPAVEVGQVYSSTHTGDVLRGNRQRRVVTEVNESFAWLLTEGKASARPTRVRLRNGRIPGYRLVSPSGEEGENR